MTRHKKTRSKKPKPKHIRYAVRIGLVPGIYPSYENGAKEQVEHIAACHQGFTKRQVSLNLHHCYMQTVLGDEQVRKFKEELLRDTTPYCPRPYTYYDCDRDGPFEAWSPPATAGTLALPYSPRPSPDAAANPPSPSYSPQLTPQPSPDPEEMPASPPGARILHAGEKPDSPDYVDV